MGGALHTEYRSCIDDPSWDELPSTQRFMAAAGSGQATVDVRIFQVVATSS